MGGISMKKLVFVLLGCLIILLTVSVVSAGEPHCTPSLTATPQLVLNGNPVEFYGNLSGMPLEEMAESKIDLYYTKVPATRFIKQLVPQRIATTYANSDGGYVLTYYPTQSGFYQTWCTPYADVTPWHSQWVRVTVLTLQRGKWVD
jgi:hypothetical protein